jgi:omega-6 fatty acid desaturase (delta-12 desaturase)
MRTGTELILATRIYAKDSPLKSWWFILSTALFLATALAGTLWNFHPIAQLLCSVLSGLLLLRLFVIYHDQQHHAILPGSRWAQGLMWVFGIFALSASSIWRSSHNHHHSHNSKLLGSHIGSFPIMTRGQFLKSSKAAQAKYLFTRHSLTILFGYFFTFIYGMGIQPVLTSPKKHGDCLLALLLHVSIGVALLAFRGWEGLLLTQTIPHFIAYAIGTYLFYAQHNFPGVSFHAKGGWTYEKAAVESSSFMRTNRIMTWFTANIGYHHIHHLNSKIPFYRLPEAERNLPELHAAKTTSLHPLEIWRCLGLKLWDVEQQCMVRVPRREHTPVVPAAGITSAAVAPVA